MRTSFSNRNGSAPPGTTSLVWLYSWLAVSTLVAAVAEDGVQATTTAVDDHHKSDTTERSLQVDLSTPTWDTCSAEFACVNSPHPFDLLLVPNHQSGWTTSLRSRYGHSGDVWFKFVAPSVGCVQIYTCLETMLVFDDNDMALNVFAVPDDCRDYDNFEDIGHNDNHGRGTIGPWNNFWTPVVEVNVEPGRMYHVQIANRGRAYKSNFVIAETCGLDPWLFCGLEKQQCDAPSPDPTPVPPTASPRPTTAAPTLTLHPTARGVLPDGFSGGSDDACSPELICINTTRPYDLLSPRTSALHQSGFGTGHSALGDVWYVFEAPASGCVTVTTCLPEPVGDMTSANSVVMIWAVPDDCTDFSSFELIKMNDHLYDRFTGPHLNRLTALVDGLSVEAGRRYLIQVARGGFAHVGRLVITDECTIGYPWNLCDEPPQTCDAPTASPRPTTAAPAPAQVVEAVVQFPDVTEPLVEEEQEVLSYLMSEFIAAGLFSRRNRLRRLSSSRLRASRELETTGTVAVTVESQELTDTGLDVTTNIVVKYEAGTEPRVETVADSIETVFGDEEAMDEYVETLRTEIPAFENLPGELPDPVVRVEGAPTPAPVAPTCAPKNSGCTTSADCCDAAHVCVANAAAAAAKVCKPCAPTTWECQSTADCCGDKVCVGVAGMRVCRACGGQSHFCSSPNDCCNANTKLHCSNDQCSKCKGHSAVCKSSKHCCGSLVCGIPIGQMHFMKMCASSTEIEKRMKRTMARR